MPSSKAAEPDVLLEPDSPSSGAARDSTMPYQPSVPCAACARGVDPLRAACISITESSVHYFCTRSCRESYVRSESAHQEKVQRAPEPLPPASVLNAQRTSSFEQVASFGLIGVAALFASRSSLTRVRGSLFGWLAAPIGVGLFALAALLAH